MQCNTICEAKESAPLQEWQVISQLVVDFDFHQYCLSTHESLLAVTEQGCM